MYKRNLFTRLPELRLQDIELHMLCRLSIRFVCWVLICRL
jgi:hypothetical protein